MKKSGISKYIKFIILSIMCVFGIVIIGTNSKAKAADYSNADSGHFYLHADGSISAEFTVSGNNLDMNGWLLCLFASEPAYNSTDHKLDNSDNLHPYSVDNCVNYFFTSNTQKTGKFFVTWSADSNDQKTNWSADGTTESEKTLADYSLSDTEYYIVIGPRHYYDGWGEDGIGAGDDGYWENCDLYVGKLSEVSKDYVLLTKQYIADIGTVEYTNESKLKIKLARTSYDALTSEQKEQIDNYNVLTSAEETYFELKKVNAPAKIAYTNGEETLYNYYDSLPEAYDALGEANEIILNHDLDISSEENHYVYIKRNLKIDLNGHILKTLKSGGKPYVVAATDSAEVTIDNSIPETGGFIGKCGIVGHDAIIILRNVRLAIDADSLAQNSEENTLAKGFVAVNINSNGDPDDNGFISIVRPANENDVIAFIEDIGTVEYTEACKNLINSAREYYDCLTDDQKALVTNYKTLTDAEAAYKEFDDNAKANATISLINAIGEVEYTDECYYAIDDARESYDSLTDDQKALVTNYKTLTDAEAAYKEFNDNAKANATIALIEAIGEVEYTDECYYAIDDARESYDSLTDDQKTLVTNYETLTEAEALYQKYEEDIDKSDATMDLIGNIGEVEYTAECKALIDAARTSYDALTDDQKELVTNYKTLTDAEAAYKVFDDPAKANATKALIDAIGDVAFTEESKSKIDQARSSYDALTADQKELITDDELKVLTDAEELYQLLKNDNDKASEVIALINAIGDVAYTEECNNAIDRAFEAYDALTLDQKALVTNYEDLEAKEAAYIILDDNAKANVTKELIVAIGEVAYTEESKDKIDLARLAYDSLTDNQKTLVTEEKLKVLTDAEALYLKLKDDNAKANSTTTLITSIGNVEYNDTCKGKINSARASYNALTADQKALVNNLKTLETAEAKYAKLENVVVKIESIKAVSYNSDSKALIDDARKVYNELTEEEKALIPNYSKLDESEKTYTTLENNHKTFVGWMITLGIILAIILLLCIEYLLFFFVFNKWVKDGDKLIRVFKVGSKDDKVTLLKMNLHIIHKNEDEIFKSKNDIQ